jgi:hypothetical protein
VTPHNGPSQGSSSIGSVSAPEVTGGIGVSGSL